MNPHHFLLALLVGSMTCSVNLANAQEGKEPIKDAKRVNKPVLVPIWKKATVGLPKEEDLDFDRNADAKEWVERLYEQTKGEVRKDSRPMMPPATPRIAAGLVVYADDCSLCARALSRISSAAEPAYEAGELYWHQWRGRGLFQLAHGPNGREILKSWIRSVEKSMLADRILHRTLSHEFVIAHDSAVYVDDIGFLPAPRSKGDNSNVRDDIFWFVMRRTVLKQIDLESGKLKHNAGEWNQGLPVNENYFLSVPLIDGSTWVVVREQDRKLRLLALDWEKHGLEQSKHIGEKGAEDLALAEGQIWQTELAQPLLGINEDTHRRNHAIHLVQAGELILSPSHLGRVVAVEAKTGKIKWTHEYAPLDAKRFPTFAPEWIVVPPVAVGNKYIYAPADFPELLCLNVADGKKVWSVKKGDGLYPAVVGEQVLAVGEKTIRSLNLKDGSEQWKLDLPGLPCGRGAILGDKYLVPVSEPKTWRGMIAMVDVKNGKITEVIKPDKDEPVGNLVVHQDYLISQTLTEIAVFPIRK